MIEWESPRKPTRGVCGTLENLRKAIHERLCGTPGIGNHRISVIVKDGVVALEGKVRTYYLKQLAQEAIIKLVPEGVTFRNLIQVVKVEEPVDDVHGST